MTLTLPPPLRTYQYRALSVFSLLDADTDRVLPHLFELCVKGGRAGSSRTDAHDFVGYREAMLAAGGVIGFDEPAERDLLDGWLRSCVVDMGTSGRGHVGEQMLALAPLTLAAYRAGLPTQRVRHRGLDDVVYRLLLAAFDRSGAASSAAALRELVVRTVGRGLEIGPAPRWEPRLAEVAALDIGALLEFRFVESFAMGDARGVGAEPLDSPLPAVTDDLGDQLLGHLRVYGDRLPVASLTSSFAALMALGAFTFTLRADLAARQLLRHSSPPPDLADRAAHPSPLELFCDFTAGRDRVCDDLARRCVERDLDRVRQGFRDRMTFVVVEQAATRLGEVWERYQGLAQPEKLVALAELRANRRVESYAMARIDDLVAAPGEAATEPEIEFLRRVQSDGAGELDTLLDVLAFVNQEKATRNAVGWFRSVGGLGKPYGILRGALGSRRSWRYAPGDELLVALLLAAFVGVDGTGARAAMPLAELLDVLRVRFGILIDRPPAFLDGAEARAAAAANVEAFTLRLQLLGCFDSLSDDFSVQLVRHPLGEL